jgi:hypothetical protein
VKCPRPVSHEALVALMAGEGLGSDDVGGQVGGGLDEATAAALEAHLFECDPCAEAWTNLASLVAGLRETIPMVISHTHRERMVASGKHLSITEVPAGVDTPARFAPGLDLMVFALKVDLADVDRVRVDIVSPDGSKRFIEEDVPFDRARGEVLVACQRHFEGMFESDPTFEVHAMQPPRHLASFRVLHAWR